MKNSCVHPLRIVCAASVMLFASACSPAHKDLAAANISKGQDEPRSASHESNRMSEAENDPDLFSFIRSYGEENRRRIVELASAVEELRSQTDKNEERAAEIFRLILIRMQELEKELYDLRNSRTIHDSALAPPKQ